MSIMAKLVYTRGTPGSRFKSNPLLGIILITLIKVFLTSASLFIFILLSLVPSLS